MAQPELDYRSLVVDIAKRHTSVSALQFICDEPERVVITPLIGGSLNHVLLVTSPSPSKMAHSLIFKHARWEMKCFPTNRLTPLRLHSEYNIMQKHSQFSPGATPKLYCLDTETNTAVMEYINNSQSLSQLLSQGKIDLNVARRVGEVIAHLHRNTWCSQMTEIELEEIYSQDSNSNMKENMRSFAYETCLDIDASYNTIENENMAAFMQLKADEPFVAAIKDLDVYVANTKQCIIHADFHASCILIQEGFIKVIDWEFTNVSIAGKDTGLILAFYAMFYLKAKESSGINTATLFMSAIKELVEAYMAEMSSVLTTDQTRTSLLRDITSFTAFYLFRFSIFADISLHIDLPSHVKIICWNCAKVILLKAPIVKKVKDLLDLIEYRKINE